MRQWRLACVTDAQLALVLLEPPPGLHHRGRGHEGHLVLLERIDGDRDQRLGELGAEKEGTIGALL